MVKKAADFRITKKRNGRNIVEKRGGGLINGPEKTKILEEAGAIKKMKPKAKAEA